MSHTVTPLRGDFIKDAEENIRPHTLPLPGKKVLTQLNRYASDFVDRRCSGLQTFLRKSASHPVLSGDNDLVAFLTLPHAPFQMYMQWNSLDSSILSLVGLRTPATPSPPQNQRLLANASTDDRVETPVDPLSVGGRGSHLARVSGSTVSGRSSQSILQASEVFTRYQSEPKSPTFDSPCLDVDMIARAFSCFVDDAAE
ncbi:unnamed protein product [Mesocestoides corti]|uniref:PX domain-containing protein n=1 Tax=Mesocestoides corti TaxID=53468 RepID=A0A0R3UNH7_MESCO|nr:unnamed protein product [Mesocestoides corti]